MDELSAGVENGEVYPGKYTLHYSTFELVQIEIKEFLVHSAGDRVVFLRIEHVYLRRRDERE